MLSDLFRSCGEQEKRVFMVLQKSGPLSKNQLMDTTGYKLTSLCRFLRSLEEKKLVVCSQFGESSGGRRPVLYDVGSGNYCLLGVDISRTYTQVAVTDLKLRVCTSRLFAMDASSTPDWTVRNIAEAAREMLAGPTGRQLVLAGVGAVGPMSREKGKLIAPAHFKAPGWKDVPIVSMLEQALHCPVALDNGANTAVLAESLYGIGRGTSRVLYVHCGVGIRMGMFLDGVLIRTPQNQEDVFGHMVVNADGRRCTCGKHGCLDCYASVRAVSAVFHERQVGGEPSALTPDAAWGDICQAGEQGDSLAADVLRQAARYLGVGLSNLISLLSPGLVILSGPLIRHSQLFYETAVHTVQKQIQSSQADVRFYRGGELEDNAISVGAAALALEEAAGVLPERAVLMGAQLERDFF